VCAFTCLLFCLGLAGTVTRSCSRKIDNLLLFSNSVDLPPGVDDFLAEVS
jgi:hypothetical protein